MPQCFRLDSNRVKARGVRFMGQSLIHVDLATSRKNARGRIGICNLRLVKS